MHWYRRDRYDGGALRIGASIGYCRPWILRRSTGLLLPTWHQISSAWPSPAPLSGLAQRILPSKVGTRDFRKCLSRTHVTGGLSSPSPLPPVSTTSSETNTNTNTKTTDVNYYMSPFATGLVRLRERDVRVYAWSAIAEGFLSWVKKLPSDCHLSSSFRNDTI
jgi:hypothetical protein